MPKKAPSNPTVAMVTELAALVEKHGLTELKVDLPEATITLCRSVGPAATSLIHAQAPTMIAAPAPVAQSVAAARVEAAPEGSNSTDAGADANGEFHVVTSPFVGTFYRQANPEAEPFVSVGSSVEKGEVLCIVEAMKLMNEIEADMNGTIKAILVDNAEPVEYGQPLFKIQRG